MKTTLHLKKIDLRVFFSPLTATIYFVLYSSPHNLSFHVEGVAGFCIKNLSRQRELAALPVDENVLSTWMLPRYLLGYCNKTRKMIGPSGWVGAGGYGSRCEGGGKVPEVKTGLKQWSRVSRWTGLVWRLLLASVNNQPIDWLFLNEFFWAAQDYGRAISHFYVSSWWECTPLPPHYSWLFFLLQPPL